MGKSGKIILQIYIEQLAEHSTHHQNSILNMEIWVVLKVLRCFVSKLKEHWRLSKKLRKAEPDVKRLSEKERTCRPCHCQRSVKSLRKRRKVLFKRYLL